MGKFLLGLAIFWLVLAIGIALYVRPAHAQDVAIGDSIAQGTGYALHVPTYARVGASSCYIMKHLPHASFRYVVVSAGINDAPGPCVARVFASIVARRVVVILPAPINSARANVMALALARGYPVVSYACPHGCSRRSFHPVSYSLLAAQVRAYWNGGF